MAGGRAAIRPRAGDGRHGIFFGTHRIGEIYLATK